MRTLGEMEITAARSRRADGGLAGNAVARDAAARDDEGDPARIAERREGAARVSVLLAELPSNQQEVIRLRFQNGLSYKQIAEVTSLSVSNVGFLIHTAIATLRKRMDG